MDRANKATEIFSDFRMGFSLLKCLIVAAFSISILLFNENKSSLPAKPGENWLILFAHPDDET